MTIVEQIVQDISSNLTFSCNISRAPMLNLEPAPQFGEISGGRDIYPTYDHPKCVDGAPIWEVEDEGDVKVYAAPMSHGVSLLVF